MNPADERGPAIDGLRRVGHPVIIALQLQVERLEREVGELTTERGWLATIVDGIRAAVLYTVVLPKLGS